jgi:hypothetical protein
LLDEAPGSFFCIRWGNFFCNSWGNFIVRWSKGATGDEGHSKGEQQELTDVHDDSFSVAHFPVLESGTDRSRVSRLTGCCIGNTPNCVEPCALQTHGNPSVQNFDRFSTDSHRPCPGTRDRPRTNQFLGIVNPTSRMSGMLLRVAQTPRL